MKVSGAVWSQFYNDEVWWEGYYHDDTLILFDDVEQEEYDKPEPGAVVKVESGYVYQQSTDVKDLPLTTFFKRWQKQQNTVILVIHVDKDYVASAKGEIKQLDGVKKVV